MKARFKCPKHGRDLKSTISTVIHDSQKLNLKMLSITMTYRNNMAVKIVNLLFYYQRHSKLKNKSNRCSKSNKMRSSKENKRSAKHVANRNYLSNSN